MKKHYFFSTMLALTFLLFLSLLPSRTAQAANPPEVYLTGDYYTNYDITGDGISDTIQIKRERESSYIYNGFSIKANGKEIFHLKNKTSYYFSSTVRLYTLKNNKVLVYIYLSENNLDGPTCGLYMYKKGKLKKILDFQTFFKDGRHNNGKVLEVSGNQLKVNYFSMSYAFAGIDMEYTYKYKKGKLVPVSKYGTVKLYNTRQENSVTARKSFWLYKNATSSKKKIKVKKGQTFRVSRSYVKGSKIRFKVELMNGKSGWVISPKDFLKKGSLAKECMYAG